MSLETVVEDIHETARERAEEIVAEGDRRAEEIIAEAERDAEQIIEDRERDVERRIQQERDRALSSASLEAKQKRLEARRDALTAVRSAVEDRVAAIDGDQREELTRSLLDGAVSEFETDDTITVTGRSDDQALLTEILDDYENLEYAGEYECLGGVVLESEDSRLRVNNTFDSVLEDVWDTQLKAISERLFGHEDG